METTGYYLTKPIKRNLDRRFENSNPFYFISAFKPIENNLIAKISQISSLRNIKDFNQQSFTGKKTPSLHEYILNDNNLIVKDNTSFGEDLNYLILEDEVTFKTAPEKSLVFIPFGRINNLNKMSNSEPLIKTIIKDIFS